MPTSTSNLETIAEVFFRAERRWTEALCNGLLDADVNNIEGWRVLGALRSGDGFTMSEISAAMAIPPPTLTRIVDRLVDSGLVVRRVDATDRRRVLVYLSARGRAKLRKLTKRESALKAALVDELGEDNAVQFIRTLSRIGELFSST
ncbi:MarR family winged helix-turn-helix transcriptional regulator [Mycobacterium sp. CVI_P3]|uniref:MarR family winged helix-turn-helix transcriptional regulator n=1 Tax=Mycobacterium pinniadriaticum TaxID=2994102 RepID=A0ABT3SI14_9MYCO|nr:MarR family winged helix-turn-helix transcriptional regulator [Mycobacterium pinniadriaticum]MCX2932791.1 MarR family winged helix-turn-helix transcriptional regulator [Mycobacterium pinniadriaticum]MCX2939149.1 MarR family winged helix-turn-helix transcriptional regulator [Mycobacterium pinniadriaticum]